MIVTSQHSEAIKHPGIGGKAYNLFRLVNEGLNVPPFVVVPNEVLQEKIQQLPEIVGGEGSMPERIEQLEIEVHLIDQIKAAFPDADQKLFSVRSSATDEDGSEFSFAGQFETFLFVKAENLAEKIKAVWASAFSDRVMTYRAENHLEDHAGIAVIVQEMVNADVAGVGFGIDPVKGSTESKVISTVFGLGEGLVSGELNADTFTVKNDQIEANIVRKEHMMVHNATGDGLSLVEVDAERQQQPSLTDGQVKEVAAVLEQLGSSLGKPQDIEFAFANNQLYLLQTRPVTAIFKEADKEGEYIIWDNSNIIESYPGVTTPLTFSFIVKMYEAVYRQFCELMGVRENVIDDNSLTFANMLGLIQGRVYYNLLSWYKVLALLPGYSINAEFMENMMGVKERFELKNPHKMSKGKAWRRLISTLFKMLRQQRRLPKERKKFLNYLDKVMAEYQAIDFDQKNPNEIKDYYLRFEQVLLKEWKAPLVNDFFAMIYFGMLQKSVGKWIGDHPNLHNDLLCGSSDIISTEPVHRLLEISSLIQNNAEANAFFKGRNEHEIWEAVNDNQFPEIAKEIKAYIQKFGERCVGELKLETISYHQDPAMFIRIVKSYVEQGITARSSEKPNIEQELRTNAEAIVKKALKGKFLKKMMFRYYLKKTRDLVSSRENLRYERTRAFGMVRTMFSAMGKRFANEGVIENDRDIFYLTKEEVFDFISGTAVSVNIKELIATRKAEFKAYEDMRPPSERIASYGMVYHANDFYSLDKVSKIEGDLEGIGCCPGVVKAKVKVVLKPDEINTLDGDILVTSSTDPGWVTLFPTASAIIVERGSLLSHSAIVSRELGIPCIVGVTGLLSTLKTGDEVEMDGSTGQIKIVNPATE
jgi:phosphohistidine swiveling domain-containing protein